MAAVRGVPVVLDTATLAIQGRVVRLYGVEGMRGQATGDFKQYLGRREVACERASRDAYRCEVDDQDLSRVVLFNGGGRAAADATPELQAAEQHARAARLGIWNANDRAKGRPAILPSPPGQPPKVCAESELGLLPGQGAQTKPTGSGSPSGNGASLPSRRFSAGMMLVAKRR